MCLTRGLGFALLLTSSCALDDDEARRAFLRNVLLDDNQDLVLRDPSRVADKFAAMAQTPYAFLRGSLGVFLRDAQQPGAPSSTPPPPGTVPDLLVVGDPHPENLGVRGVRADGLEVDFNDFDACRYGPSHLDLRRLTSSLAVACDLIAPDDDEFRQGMVAELTAGYLEMIREGTSPPGGAVIGWLLKKAREDGLAREELLDDDGISPASADELILVKSILEDARAGTAAAAWTPVAAIERRSGRGVASRAVLRFRVRLVGDSDIDDDDDVFLDVKEARDPVALPGLFAGTARPFQSNAARITACERALVGDGRDLFLSAGGTGLSFRVARDVAFHKGLRVEKLAEKWREGQWDQADMMNLARFLGARLGDAHRRSVRADGQAALPALQEQIDDDNAAAWTKDSVSFADAYLKVHLHDHALFASLLDEHGPLLGGRSPGLWLPQNDGGPGL